MLAAQILSLLYNIVDRIYIAAYLIWEPLHSVAVGAFAFLFIMLTIAFSNLFGSVVLRFFNKKRHE